MIIYLLAVLREVHLNRNPLALLGVIIIIMLASACFSTFSVIIACLGKTRERVMEIGQVLPMPAHTRRPHTPPMSACMGSLYEIGSHRLLPYVGGGGQGARTPSPPTAVGCNPVGSRGNVDAQGKVMMG